MSKYISVENYAMCLIFPKDICSWTKVFHIELAMTVYHKYMFMTIRRFFFSFSNGSRYLKNQFCNCNSAKT